MKATIGTFDIYPEGEGFVCDDRDGFNNWGRAHFDDAAEALHYAEWAHSFKRGGTMQDFDSWRANRLLMESRESTNAAA